MINTTLRIQNLEIQTSIGIHATERENLQRTLVSLELFTTLTPPQQDAIEETVCYETLINKINALAQIQHYNLLETLGAKIVEVCLADIRITSGTITLLKPDIIQEAQGVGITLTFARP